MWPWRRVTPWCWAVLRDVGCSGILSRTRHSTGYGHRTAARGLAVPDCFSAMPDNLPVFEAAVPDKFPVMMPLLMLLGGVLFLEWGSPRRLSRFHPQAPHKQREAKNQDHSPHKALAIRIPCDLLPGTDCDAQEVSFHPQSAFQPDRP